MGRKLGGLYVPLWGGELGPHLTQCGQGRDLSVKFHLDPSNRLATVHERYRQTDRTGQLSHILGRTVLQTVDPKRVKLDILKLGTHYPCSRAVDTDNV